MQLLECLICPPYTQVSISPPPACREKTSARHSSRFAMTNRTRLARTLQCFSRLRMLVLMPPLMPPPLPPPPIAELPRMRYRTRRATVHTVWTAVLPCPDSLPDEQVVPPSARYSPPLLLEEPFRPTVCGHQRYGGTGETTCVHLPAYRAEPAESPAPLIL